MKLSLHLAYKNLIGGGTRTWLNVSVLTFIFIFIVFYNAFINGWQNQGRMDAINWEFGYGQLRNEDYDPYDPFSLENGHGNLPYLETENLVPVLIRQASLYPDGRLYPIQLKGIEAEQGVLKLPTGQFGNSAENIQAIIGKRMAEAANLEKGDQVLLRWRDKNGTFDAGNATIVDIFNSTVATIDNGQIWIPIQKLREMTGLEGETTYFVAKESYAHVERKGWNFITQSQLLKDLDSLVQMERIGSAIIYMIFLAIALLALFDTQVLSIFRRQREIGTYVALGMTRRQVNKLFVTEGSMYSIMAVAGGLIIGSPLFIITASRGIPLPSKMIEDAGIPMASRIYPDYTGTLIVLTVVLLIVSATLVSMLPARKISKMNIVNALKGKLS